MDTIEHRILLFYETSQFDFWNTSTDLLADKNMFLFIGQHTALDSNIYMPDQGQNFKM